MANHKVLASVFFVLLGLLIGICSAKRHLSEEHVSAYGQEVGAGADEVTEGYDAAAGGSDDTLFVGDNVAAPLRDAAGYRVSFVPRGGIRMVDADIKTHPHYTQTSFAFIYGTLKRDFPNHRYFKEDIDKNEATFIGTATTQVRLPLITGPYGTPYMLYLPNNGKQVKVEVYSVSAEALAHLDKLEETSVCHYKRHTVLVTPENCHDQDIDDQNGIFPKVVLADAYFAYKCYGEKMWERYGKQGLSEFSKDLGKEYARQFQCRPKNHYFLADIGLFLSGECTTCEISYN